MMETIWVRSLMPDAPDGGHGVALLEVDPVQPGGIAYVGGPQPVEVVRTAAVADALQAGRIEELTPADVAAAAPPEQSPKERAAAGVAAGAEPEI